MGKKRGREFGILFSLVALVVMVNTSFMFLYFYAESHSTVMPQTETTLQGKTFSSMFAPLFAKPDDSSTIRDEGALVLKRNSGTSSSGRNDEQATQDDSVDDTDEPSLEQQTQQDTTQSETEDYSQETETDDESDSSDEASFEAGDEDVDYDLEEVPENEDGPSAEPVEGKDLQFNFGFGGFG